MAAIMIDYATLCRAIEDWKSGRQPSAVTPAAPRRIAAPAQEDEEAVEYSAVYDTNDLPAEQPGPDPTGVYQLSEYEGDVDADVDADEVDVTDDER
ncbi:MAG TPA: hypothetical protein VGB85_32410 [Nannocystis sp.]|jgi:hypothetical protein